MQPRPLLHSTRLALATVLTATSPLISCGSPPVVLNPAASEVRFEDKPFATTAGLDAVGEVYCQFGSNLLTMATNMRHCRDELRNEAHRLGGSVVIVDSEVLGTEGCTNCITMFGTAYKEKGPEATSQ